MTRQIKLRTWFFRRFQTFRKRATPSRSGLSSCSSNLLFSVTKRKKERKKEKKRRKTNRWNNSIQCRAVEYTVYRLKSLRKRFEGTRSRCLADVVEQLCSIDPSNDSVITCKYLPISRNDKQPTSATIFDELCPRFPAIYTFCTDRYIAHVVLKLR